MNTRTRDRRPTLRPLFAALLLLPAAGCATTGSTFRSGVGERILDEPPYYAGTPAGLAGPIAHVPIAYQPGAAQPALFDPDASPDSPITALLAEMNAYLDGLGATTRLATTLPGVAPDVRLGCDQDVSGDCLRDPDHAETAGGYAAPWLRLAVGRPSTRWIEAAAAAMAEAGADRVLVITLEVGQYWPHQRNLRGDKEVRLGTDHAVPVPWLTALDQPVQVLQLTGALVGPDGRADRIGAEGLVARRTNVVLVSFGVHALLSDDDVEHARTAVRTDLPGQPLVWKAALHALVAGLTGSPGPGAS